MKKLAIAFVSALLLIAAALWAQAPPEGSGCMDDHWGAYCTGYPTPVGQPYFSCSTGWRTDSIYWCCKYQTQDHSCQFPPPSTVKYFDFVGADHCGPCNSVDWGQFCTACE